MTASMDLLQGMSNLDPLTANMSQVASAGGVQRTHRTQGHKHKLTTYPKRKPAEGNELLVNHLLKLMCLLSMIHVYSLKSGLK